MSNQSHGTPKVWRVYVRKTKRRVSWQVKGVIMRESIPYIWKRLVRRGDTLEYSVGSRE